MCVFVCEEIFLKGVRSVKCLAAVLLYLTGLKAKNGWNGEVGDDEISVV